MGVAGEVARGHAPLARALDVLWEALESLLTLPAIAGSAYLYARLLAWSRLASGPQAPSGPAAAAPVEAAPRGA